MPGDTSKARVKIGLAHGHAIEVLQSMEEQKVELNHTVKIYAFKDEEGSRFGHGMIGSRAVAGTLTPEVLEKKMRME